MTRDGLQALPRHLVSVWNPFYSDVDAMAAHLRILLESVQRDGRDGAHVWWGKIRSANRRPEQQLPHDLDLLELSERLAARAADEVQLYLTDYRSLYVAHVTAIEFADVRSRDGASVPEYYRTMEREVDCWFRLSDVQRVATDLLDVARELAWLKNVHFDYKSVSLYGGMYELPLVVVRPDGRRFFDPSIRRQVIGERLWAEAEAERGDAHVAMEAELRDNVLGEATWSALDPAARPFIAAAERAFRDHRHEASYDFGPVLVQFAKALELHLNALLAAGLRAVGPRERTISLGNGRTAEIGCGVALGVGQLAGALEMDLRHTVARCFEQSEMLTKHVRPFLAELAQWRNEGAHRDRVERGDAHPLRNRLMGIGSEGILTRLARVRPKGSGAPGN